MPSDRIVFGTVTGINQAAIRVYAADEKAEKGMEFKAMYSNSGVVYVGNADVSVASGYPLVVSSSVGESLFLNCRQVNDLYVIGDANSVNDELRFYFI